MSEFYGEPTVDEKKKVDEQQQMLSNLEDSFREAAARVKTCKNSPSNTDLLILYGLYKQVTEGNCNTPQPWAVQIQARAKWDAWYKNKNMDKRCAMCNYIDKVEQIMQSQK
jgi:diazepam-binding inhibitor (GABA receptor modulating acyl-CoA-binding protein)